MVCSEHSDWPLRLYSVVVPDNCCLYDSIAVPNKTKKIYNDQNKLNLKNWFQFGIELTLGDEVETKREFTAENLNLAALFLQSLDVVPASLGFVVFREID